MAKSRMAGELSKKRTKTVLLFVFLYDCFEGYYVQIIFNTDEYVLEVVLKSENIRNFHKKKP